jgi:hypothetical protein
MPAPVVTELTERIYELLEPLHADDEAYGYGLMILASAAAAMMEETYGWSNGDEEDAEPWQHLIDRSDMGDGLTPNEYLAQLLGLQVRIMEPDLLLLIMEDKLAFMRGTTEYLEAMLNFSMGSNAVGVYERSDGNFLPSPYGILLRTKLPLTAAAQRLVDRWKPAGFRLYVVSTPIQTYSELALANASYTVLSGAYANYSAINAIP